MSTSTSFAFADLVCSAMPTCSDCKTDTAVFEDYAQGRYVCRNCAIILGPVISEGAEWRTFENDSKGGDKIRVDRVNNDFELSSSIQNLAEDSALRRLHNQNAMNSNDRALLSGYEDITKMCNRLRVNARILQSAKEIYKRIFDKQLFRRRRSDAILVACIFVSCRKEDNPRTMRDICSDVRVNASHAKKFAKKIMDLKLYKQKYAGVDFRGFLTRFCDQLNLPKNVCNAAIDIANKANALGIAAGRQPGSRAGAALYLACQLSVNESRSLAQIAEAVKMAESTVRQTYQEYYPQRKELVPTEFASQATVEALPL